MDDPTRIAKARIQDLAAELVAENSVSSRSNVTVNQKVAARLETLGFEIEWLGYRDSLGVEKSSLVARRNSQAKGSGGVGYFAHTDVVPVDDWDTGFSGPFEAVEREGRLYGRGTCDMKGSLSCAIQAASKISVSEQKGPIYLVVTGDEEIGMQGAREVDKRSQLWQEMIERDVVGIIGEPTELQVVHAHKGNTGVILRSVGQSAHTSTGQGINANYKLIPALVELLELREQTENGPEFRNSMFNPDTVSMNILIHNEPKATNVTTAIAEAQISFRTMPGVDTEEILSRIRKVQQKHQLAWIDKGEISHWSVDSKSTWVKEMLQILGEQKSFTVGYGTDGAVLQRLPRLLVCGPGSIEQAHRKDEWIAVEQLEKAVKVYEQAFRKWAC